MKIYLKRFRQIKLTSKYLPIVVKVEVINSRYVSSYIEIRMLYIKRKLRKLKARQYLYGKDNLY